MRSPPASGSRRIRTRICSYASDFSESPSCATRCGCRSARGGPAALCGRFEATAYTDAEQLCADPFVQAVYIASPHELHVCHARLAAKHGKHILVEKPMATTIDDCRAMIDQAKQAGVHLLVGHSHSFDLPYQRTKELIDSGVFGAVRMINAVNFTDFVYRPRRADELNTGGIGGGVVFSQGAHQVDIVRLLAGSPALSVSARTASFDASRPTEGAYSARILFQNGAFASLTYSGYGRFDTDEFNGWIGETGGKKDPTAFGQRAAVDA